MRDPSRHGASRMGGASRRRHRCTGELGGAAGSVECLTQESGPGGMRRERAQGRHRGWVGVEDRRDGGGNKRACTATCSGDNPCGRLCQGSLLTRSRRRGGECGGPRSPWRHAPTSAPSAVPEEGKTTENQLGLGAPLRGREHRVKARDAELCWHESANRDGRAGSDSSATAAATHVSKPIHEVMYV